MTTTPTKSTMPTTAAPINAVVHRWNDLPQDCPMDLLSRRRIIGTQMMISQVQLKRGCFVPTHQHANEQFACIMSGSLKFCIGAEGDPSRRMITVKAGEVMHLPSNVPHSAEALEDTLVLDLFSPPSETTGVDREPRGH